MPAGIVSWWRADGDASDSAGNNNGVLAGNATYGLGRRNKCFVFDGDRDAVMVGTGTNLHLQNFTIEAWIKRASAIAASLNGNSNAQIFAVGNDPGGVGLAIRQVDNRLMLNKSGAGWVSSDARVADTEWHHVAVTKQGKKVVFYVDGNAFPAAAFDPGSFTFSAPAYVAGWLNRAGQIDNSLYGWIDELAIFDRELTATEITEIYHAGSNGKCTVSNQQPSCVEPPSGLLSWWQAEDHAFDSIDANHGVFIGNAVYNTGKVGKGFFLDGLYSGVRLGSCANLQRQDFSIEAWIKRASSSGISLGHRGGAYIFSLGGSKGGLGFYLRPDSSLAFEKLRLSEIASTARISDTNWHHVAITKSGTTVIFYVDAVAYPAQTFESGNFAFLGPAYIGARLGQFGQVEDTFHGTIDEVGFYGRPLTPAEVLGQFNAGTAGKCSSPTPPEITLQPKHQTVTELDYAMETVGVRGSPPFGYQWRRYDTSIAAANGSTLELPVVSPADAGVYSVFITNLHGAVTSSNATLVVNPLLDCVPLSAGLAGWWSGESNVSDTVASNSGTLMNQAGFSLGRVGMAFAFNGNNQFVRFPDAASFNPTNALTLECWFYLEQYSTNDGVAIANKDDSSSSYDHDHQYGLGLVNFTGEWVAGALLNLPGGMVMVQGVTPIILHKWYHLAMTYDGSALRLYLDGTLQGNVAAAGPIKRTPVPFRIGGHPTGPWGLNGRVDELSLYHRALQPAEIRSIYTAGGAGKCPLRCPVTPLPPGLIGWWAAESNAVDSISGAVANIGNESGYAPGRVGTAFYFNTNNQLIRIANTAALNPANGMTLECWINVQQFPTNGLATLVSKGYNAASRNQFALEIAYLDRKWVCRAMLELSGGQVVAEGAATISTSIWFYVTMTYDGSDLRIYLNGVLDSSTTARGQIAPADFPLVIGGNDSVAPNFAVSVDEVCLYDRAVSSREIAANYLTGRAGKSLTDARPSTRDLRKWFFGEQKAKSSSPPAVESR